MYLSEVCLFQQLRCYVCMLCLNSHAIDGEGPFLVIFRFCNHVFLSSIAITSPEQLGASHEKTCYAISNNKGAAQPAHPCSLISAFVIRCLDSIIPLVSDSEISSLCLASVAAQAGLSVSWSQTTTTGFVWLRLICWLSARVSTCCGFRLCYSSSWCRKKATVFDCGTPERLVMHIILRM